MVPKRAIIDLFIAESPIAVISRDLHVPKAYIRKVLKESGVYVNRAPDRCKRVPSPSLAEIEAAKIEIRKTW